jgi:DNA adenine methylase
MERNVVHKRFPSSPLQYPGGKSKAAKTIAPLLSDKGTIISPFLGGGSVELALSSLGVKVIAYDALKPLISFWRQLFDDPQALRDAVAKYYPLSREQFYALRKLHRESDSLLDGQLFFVMNRSSFSGVTLNGGTSDPSHRFNESAINKLIAPYNFRDLAFPVTVADWRESIAKHPNSFLYCDPPYLIKDSLYGVNTDLHKNFDHAGLAEALKKHKGGWLLSYNNCPKILDLYQEFDISCPEWTYGMSADKNSKEVLICKPA